ncbi:MAG TPA: hypothetical protein VK957_12385 [Lunatimonas sp.]|nr:hypothetical protein [Lunatimonas sp.]
MDANNQFKRTANSEMVIEKLVSGETNGWIKQAQLSGEFIAPKTK